MERSLQGEATMAILESCDIIIASSEKGIGSKVGKQLGGKLGKMGVSREEAKALLKIIEQKLFDDSDDDDVSVLVYQDDEEDFGS